MEGKKPGSKSTDNSDLRCDWRSMIIVEYGNSEEYA
jgi:hypothetical protein